MLCDLCGTSFLDGDEVRMETPGEIVKGVFAQVEESRIMHEECPEEEED